MGGDFNAQDSLSKNNFWCKVGFSLDCPKKIVFISTNKEENIFYDSFIEDLTLWQCFLLYIVVTLYVCS